MASSLAIFSNLAKNYPERAYMRAARSAHPEFPTRLVSNKKDRISGEKNARKKDLVEEFKRIQK